MSKTFTKCGVMVRKHVAEIAVGVTTLCVVLLLLAEGWTVDESVYVCATCRQIMRNRQDPFGRITTSISDTECSRWLLQIDDGHQHEWIRLSRQRRSGFGWFSDIYVLSSDEYNGFFVVSDEMQLEWYKECDTADEMLRLAELIREVGKKVKAGAGGHAGASEHLWKAVDDYRHRQTSKASAVRDTGDGE